MVQVSAEIKDETLVAELVTEHIHINLAEETIAVFLNEEEINVEIKDEVIEVNFGDVVAINERALVQGIPYIDDDYLYVVFTTDVKRTDRTTWVVDYAFFQTAPSTLAEVQALF